jgi:dienelactone hydrolase
MEKIAFGPDLSGYVCGDAGNPGVVVIQEWWGVNENVKSIAKKIAARGYRALIPDLYRGKIGVDAEEAHHLMTNLDWGGAAGACPPRDVSRHVPVPETAPPSPPPPQTKMTIVVSSSHLGESTDRGKGNLPRPRFFTPGETLEAARFLQSEGSPRVGVVGFCMGGALTLIVASKAEAAALVACAVSFYGVPGADACDLSRVACPLQAHFGEEDALEGFSDPSAAKRLEDALTSAAAAAGTRKRFEILRYPRVGHAFLNDLPEPFADFDAREKAQGFPPRDEAVVAEAWANLEKFFDEHLGEKKE